MKTLDSTIFVNGLQRPVVEPFVLVMSGFERRTITFLSHPTFTALFTCRVREFHLISAALSQLVGLAGVSLMLSGDTHLVASNKSKDPLRVESRS